MNDDALPSTAPATKLPKDTVLRLENLHLKLQNVHMQMQLIQQELKQSIDAKNKLQADMEAVRRELLAEYGVDISTCRVLEDGSVVPTQPPNPMIGAGVSRP